MPVFVSVGRVLFAILFIVSGAYKFMDLSAMAQMIASKITVPTDLVPYTTQIETAIGLPFMNVLAIVSGAVEILGGLFIAVNLGARFFAILLALFVAVTTFYFHNFWAMSGTEIWTTLFEALKNLSLFGGLLIIAGLPKTPPVTAEPQPYAGI